MAAAPAIVPELARDLARLPPGVEVTCAGPSMEPAIARGQRVRVHAGEIAPGDVFVFETAGGELEMHRLVLRVPGGWLVHRGDNQQIAGFDLTRVEKVIGRARIAARRPGRRERGRALVEVARRTARVLWRRVAGG